MKRKKRKLSKEDQMEYDSAKGFAAALQVKFNKGLALLIIYGDDWREDQSEPPRPDWIDDLPDGEPMEPL